MEQSRLRLTCKLSIHVGSIERIPKQWLVSPIVACVSHLLCFRHDLVRSSYLRIADLLHLLLSLHHSLLLSWVELHSVDLARQVVSAEQDVHIISIENSLKLLVHCINLPKKLFMIDRGLLYLRSYLGTKAKLWWRTLSSQALPYLGV